ncbi:sugar porter (SP) family MFS transporter [Saccharopolyspora lacisalsi]|uniref:Sugar porter (SP) family MFS transporter n=1 Tax=Halosaccharopolyspora lacisalsi TaxID=1000566 RepID=A0A839E1R3_9PSEU|nr:sugar porter family MFS transporter [Halosaccharopolyspora lacisalsi]MBA8824888.1 sugar porter (SP) family MFS transporter [Halosaccharopolyspora lacisalsi]
MPEGDAATNISGNKELRGLSGTALVVGASVTAAFGGLLFGYDTGVVAAALPYITDAFDLGETLKQIVTAALLAGAVVGVIVGGSLSDRLGRKKTLTGVTVLYAVATLGSAVAAGTVSLITSRIFLGIAIGISSLVVPTYIAEIAPPKNRGTLVSLHQFMVTVGILFAYLVGYGLSGSASWRWMIAVGIAPAVLMFVGLFALPESPRWLVSRRREREARAVLARARPAEDVDAEITDIVEAVRAEGRITYRELLGTRFRRWISVGVVAAGASQVVGVNAIIYYVPTILEEQGFGKTAAIGVSVAVGIVNVVFTIPALLWIDRFGRRPWILGGTVVIILSLIAVGIVFQFPIQGAAVVWLIVALMVYESAFACSLGIAIWLVNSEIFPNNVRGKAASFGIVTHWGMNLVVSVSVLTLITAMGASAVFWLYAFLGLLCLIYLYRWLPETKNRSLEEIEADLTGEVSVSRAPEGSPPVS